VLEGKLTMDWHHTKGELLMQLNALCDRKQSLAPAAISLLIVKYTSAGQSTFASKTSPYSVTPLFCHYLYVSQANSSVHGWIDCHFLASPGYG